MKVVNPWRWIFFAVGCSLCLGCATAPGGRAIDPEPGVVDGPAESPDVESRDTDTDWLKTEPDAGMSEAADADVEPFLERRSSAGDLGELHDRVLEDLKAGKPLVTTVYVALCDNDSQGIIPVKNRSICNGDTPMQNMYWAGRNGLAGVAKKKKWKSVSRVVDPDGDVLIEQVWLRWIYPGAKLKELGIDKPVRSYIVGRAYRGNKIHRAFVDYLHAVHDDTPLKLQLEDKVLFYGGGGHVVGYVGHDYMMDVYPGSEELIEILGATRGESSLAKGVFALACAGDSYIRPFISRENIYVLALNVYLAFPNAWTIEGILDGISTRGSGREIHRAAAKGFARGQKCGMKWARKALAYGP